jgi:hypothetical protein
VLRACYKEITGEMQKTLHRLAREHPRPIVDRLREIDLRPDMRRLEQLFAAPQQPPNRQARHA